MDLAMALAEQQRRRPGRRQRPGRRPLRRRRPRPARLADAARRRGRRAARPRTCSRAGKQGTYATSIVSSSLLGRMAAAAGPAVRRDAHRLQVDRPGRGPRVRLRGGAGLLRRPRAREGQGRRLGAAAALRARRRAPRPTGRGLRRPARRHRRRARPARHRPAVGAGHRPRRDRRRHGPAARHPARPRWAGWRSSRSTTSSLGSADLPPTEGLRYRLAEGARVIVRPSGTEPKLKCYLEVVVPVNPEDGVEAARISAAGRLDALRGDIKAGRRDLTRASAGQRRQTEQRATDEARRRPPPAPTISGQAGSRRTPRGQRQPARRSSGAMPAPGAGVLGELADPLLDEDRRRTPAVAGFARRRPPWRPGAASARAGLRARSPARRSAARRR